METGMGFAQIAVSAGIQAFFVLFLWRMARHLYPFIEAIKDLDAPRVATSIRLAEINKDEDARPGAAV
jgi:hypothetical protein